MKRKINFILFLLLIILSSMLAYNYREDLVATVKDTLNIKPKQYFGATVDMSQILPESQHYIVNSQGEDLIDLAARLGMNTLRITNITSPTDQTITTSYTHEQWNEVLSKMKKKGIYAVILIESNSKDKKFFKHEIDSDYPNFVKQYVIDNNLCSFSNILVVDIRNEPLLDQHNLTLLKESSDLIRTSCPTMKITIGSWKLGSNWHDPKGAAVIKDIVDLYAIHVYGYDKLVKNVYPDPYNLAKSYIHEIKKYSGNKPILIEEFGAGNGSSLTDQHTLGSQNLQKNAYEKVLKLTSDYKNKNVIGAIGYLFYRRTRAPDGWEIVEQNGDILLPAALTFKQ
ncbi:MAG TPA: cellulase family glycosylhydrolase [Candidatus Sulfotelmatobacter sp.]|jgi:hypothetical protein|nr:cellulase family glycosylhydrolase [Candidatus Sulfotelmatobacter sp.]